MCEALFEFFTPGGRGGSERHGKANTQISFAKTQKTDTHTKELYARTLAFLFALHGSET
jgi:hypothetical protein